MQVIKGDLEPIYVAVSTKWRAGAYLVLLLCVFVFSWIGYLSFTGKISYESWFFSYGVTSLGFGVILALPFYVGRYPKWVVWLVGKKFLTELIESVSHERIELAKLKARSESFAVFLARPLVFWLLVVLFALLGGIIKGIYF